MPTFNEKMTALADAIRAKTGLVGKLTIDQMVTAVSSLSGGASSGGLPTGDLTAYNARVAVSGSSGYDQNIIYTQVALEGSGDSEFILWEDSTWESALWLIYQPAYDGTQSGTPQTGFSTNHKWTLYQSGVIFYCDEDDPTTDQWYLSNGTAFNGITIEFQAK